MRTSTTNPSQIIFSGCNIIQSTNQSTINVSEVVFQSENRLTVNQTITFNLITIKEDCSLSIESGSKIKLSGLSLEWEASLLTIKNSILDFISANTDPIRIGDPPEKPGNILNQGNIQLISINRLLSSTGNQLIIDPQVTLEFTAGSRLNIDSQTHFTIE